VKDLIKDKEKAAAADKIEEKKLDNAVKKTKDAEKK